MNDQYGVTCWQEATHVELTTDEAREYAREIVAAADQADAVAEEDENPMRFAAHGFDVDQAHER